MLSRVRVVVAPSVCLVGCVQQQPLRVKMVPLSIDNVSLCHSFSQCPMCRELAFTSELQAFK